MNHDFLIRITNRIALYATLALIYWVFVFLIITIFDLKIFQERMTETFLLSILGIFAILGGAIVLNIMSNLSKISAVISAKHDSIIEGQGFSRFRFAVMLLLFPLIVGGLFAGNELSAQRKKDLLINSAQKLVSENQATFATLSDYKFSLEYIKKSENTLGVIKKIDENLPTIILIVPDIIDGKKLFLAFGGREYDEKEQMEKSSYIFSTSQDERDYLEKVFTSNEVNYRFRAEKSNYQLYFPVSISGRKIVLYFSDYQRYGKFCS